MLLMHEHNEFFKNEIISEVHHKEHVKKQQIYLEMNKRRRKIDDIINKSLIIIISLLAIIGTIYPIYLIVDNQKYNYDTEEYTVKYGTYRVKAGDTFYEIVDDIIIRHNINNIYDKSTYRSIIKDMNPYILDYDKIEVGMSIHFPYFVENE